MENSEKLFLYSERRLGKTSLIHSSRWMSFQPAIPGGLLSSRARVRFTSRRHSAAAPASMSTQLHRTVLCDCVGFLSPGVHRKLLRDFRVLCGEFFCVRRVE